MAIMSDLVSGVLTRLAEIEKTAEAARDTYWDDEADERRPSESVWHADGQFVTERPSGDTIAACTWDDYEHTHMRVGVSEHIAMNDPEAVLRLCRAHRQIVDMAQRAAEAGDSALMTAGEHARSATLDEVVELLAVGLGVVEEEDRK